MYQLEETHFFILLIIIPIIWVGFFIISRWKKNKQEKFASTILMNYLSPNRSKFKTRLKLFIFSLSILCLVFALVNPKIGTQLETVKREGVDIVFTVDVSKSMIAEDVAPNRLEKTKRLVSAILNELVSDRIGIVAYAAQAIPQLPITTDYGSAKMFLQALNTDMLSSQGTALNSAIDLATTFFNDNDQTNRLIFLISDGEDHYEKSYESAKKASDLGIKIFTFGIGSEKGAPIPIKRNGIIESYKKDIDGEVVITKKNEEVLTKIAEVTGGLYKEGNNTNDVIEFVVKLLKDMDKKEFEAKKFVSYKDRFQSFLIGALFFLIIDLLLFEKKTKWLQKLNLFNESNNV